METLSVELHAQIFEFACVDGGATARALALVSHYIREVARPFLYQSLGISGHTCISELQSRLASLPPYLRRIRHLFLSDWELSRIGERASSEEKDVERYEREKIAAMHILALAAPTLESLTIIASCPYTSTSLIAHLYSLPLPHLRELSIRGFYPFPVGVAQMPVLERLYLGGNRNPHGLLRLGALEAACPGLTHLCVSGLISAVSFANELREASLRLDDAHQAKFPAVLPRTLRHIAINPGSLPTKTSATARISHQKMLCILEEMVACCSESQPVQLTLHNESKDSYREMLRHWEGRLLGHDGCWP
ncbi:uncharacterized protein FIBRA_08586 [Fibroporia radiculosa]|uniref:F-box domain-containing protein n=1 Tax=Fibroporia radiculosa TaxID=599839 RepID=J4GHS0_9APHY|nr:uncharacterized protein FIBRA_08586 [Fibroporia radiculosa]CCM06333.1 predicted protein [Fibroporia radiculosa]